jgi:hypothetical protein
MSDDMTVKSVNFHDGTIEELERVMDEYDVGFSEAVRRAVNNTLMNDDESPFAEQRLKELKTQRNELEAELTRLDDEISSLEESI